VGVWDILILLVVQGGFFVLLALALRFFFLKQVQTALARLRALQEEAMVKETQLKEELERARTQSASIVAAAQQEAAALREQVRSEVAQIRMNADVEGQQEKKEIIESGRKDLLKLEEKLRRQAQDDAVDIAAQYTAALLSEGARAGFDRVYFSESLSAFESLSLDMRVIKAHDVRVVSARAFAEDERERIAGVLSRKTNGLSVIFAVDSALVGGFIVTIGEFVADGSLRNRIAKLAATAKG
jgi:F0F1-type ATP synthase membrane subunit b/b'